MQNLFVHQMRAWLLRPTVVHRLPGRLRLRLPALQKLPREQQEWALLWRDLLCSPEAIQAVEINLLTGNALIRYDSVAITEAEVLNFMHSVNRFVLRHWDRLAATSADALPAVVRKLQQVAGAALRHRPVLPDNLEVPDDLWA
jgi:hypothetical protein